MQPVSYDDYRRLLAGANLTPSANPFFDNRLVSRPEIPGWTPLEFYQQAGISPPQIAVSDLASRVQFPGLPAPDGQFPGTDARWDYTPQPRPGDGTIPVSESPRSGSSPTSVLPPTGGLTPPWNFRFPLSLGQPASSLLGFSPLSSGLFSGLNSGFGMNMFPGLSMPSMSRFGMGFPANFGMGFQTGFGMGFPTNMLARPGRFLRQRSPLLF